MIALRPLVFRLQKAEFPFWKQLIHGTNPSPDILQMLGNSWDLNTEQVRHFFLCQPDGFIFDRR